MEKPINPSTNSGFRLPIGFRFHPTDEELLLHYLKRKLSSLPLPASLIPQLDVFRTNPRDLPGDPRENRYFFSSRMDQEQVHGNYKQCSNTTSVKDGSSGYWKPIGLPSRILSPAGINQTIGMKRSLAFYQGKRPNGSRTEWIMHAYCLVASSTSNTYTNLQNVLQVGDWIVCHIYKKQRKIKNHSRRNKEATSRELVIRPCIWDFMKEDTSDFSCSSGITNVSCNHELDQEVNSDDNSSKLF